MQIFWKHEIHYMIGGGSHSLNHESNLAHLMKDILIDLCTTCAILRDWWSLSLLMFSS